MVVWTFLFMFLPGSIRNVHRSHTTWLTAKGDSKLETAMQSMGYSRSTRDNVQKDLESVGLSSCLDLENLARDFVDRPEIFSSLLQSDFGISPLVAHQTRAAVMMILEKDKSSTSPDNNKPKKPATDVANVTNEAELKSAQKHTVTAVKEQSKRPLYKSVIVNEKAQKRRRVSSQEDQKHDYGLPHSYRLTYPSLATELDDFNDFMTKPSTNSQEQPIRPATASVYMRHAKLFLGWFVNQQNESLDTDSGLSLESIVPNKEKESASVIFDFVMWLRSNRSISHSYEANLLRGLIKLLKFRFRNESKSDPSYGGKSFEDIPMIRELRKLHRDANKRQAKSSRSSDEGQKWLSWSEYLQVIKAIKSDLLKLLDDFENSQKNKKSAKVTQKEIRAKKKIAITYQQYLVLAFFASIPDRQRTVRELEIGKSFVKDEKNGVYVVKHGSEDYKTGKTYGDRPPLPLSKDLVPAIDDFLTRWRPCLLPNTDFLFVQPRTGNPVSQDSVYQTVGRSCYKYTGKKTNPHLLRDMIVTYVRDSNASEKELEALALYMGHSIQMQRTSYDRRTFHAKVKPAVELLQSVNKQNMAARSD